MRSPGGKAAHSRLSAHETVSQYRATRDGRAFPHHGAIMGYRILHREWKAPAVFWYLIFVELGLTVALLVLFGIQQPDLIRTALWQAGDDMNFNSSPKVILYAYANYEPLPTLPFVWSET